jgi:mono/diheme cytochrome c family protein
MTSASPRGEKIVFPALRGRTTRITARDADLGRRVGWRRKTSRLACSAIAAALVLVATGCGREEPDLVNGKQLFVEQCGTCHALERAGTQAARGPDLDAAFAPAREDGLGEETVQGVIREQIANVRVGSAMPEDLVTGADAQDVAAYVAEVAGMPGEDTGQLASAGLAGATEPEQIYTAAGCGGCHTFTAAGTNASVGPNLDELASAADQRVPNLDAEEYAEEAIVDPDAFVVDGFSAGVMPDNYGEQLDEEQVGVLVEYLLNPEGG